jgi:hypothetical protein
MVSLEPWTIGGCGYPDLLASGEQCNGEKIHDRQHPHDLLMEISAEHDAPLKGSLRWQVYGGPVGEPALGPVAYPHRLSAMPNPMAPIAHHWLDSTHVAFGVITGGLYGGRWKAESSVFNGREPDEERADFDFGALDSVSGRLWFLPNSSLALQLSAGRLREAEEGEVGLPRNDVTKITASAMYHRPKGDDSIWATTIVWGRNEESGHGSNALLIETNLMIHERDAWFGRFEAVGKTGPRSCGRRVRPSLCCCKAPRWVYAVFRRMGGIQARCRRSAVCWFRPEATRTGIRTPSESRIRCVLDAASGCDEDDNVNAT